MALWHQLSENLKISSAMDQASKAPVGDRLQNRKISCQSSYNTMKMNEKEGNAMLNAPVYCDMPTGQVQTRL